MLNRLGASVYINFNTYKDVINRNMVLVQKSDHSITSKKKLLSTTSLGIGLLVIPMVIKYFDPFLYITLHKLRVENGSLIHELLLRRLECPKIYLYIFNVTNAEEFLSGRDEKVKLEEIGPFVYQEFRTNEDLEINKEPGIMRYTPKLQLEFILEESIGSPEDFLVTVPNVAMLSATALMSKYPYFLQQVFNMVAASCRSTAFKTIRAHEHIWGHSDPLINLANRVVPGLIYFKSVGLMERLYDTDADYRLEIGTNDSEKFSVKKAMKFRSKNTDGSILVENTYTYNDAYEGAVFPPGMSPETPINIFRHSICNTIQLQHVGSRSMYYGGDVFVYHIHNTTFMDHLCDSKGWCPYGLKNYASCYFGLPIVLSKGHFLDSDPQLLDRVEGLKPDRKIHDTEILIDPKIGVGITGSMTLQLNLFLADVGYNPQARRLKDTVLPVSQIIVKAPPMLEEVRSTLQLIYSRGPYILLAVQTLCILLGLGLLAYSARLTYWNWLARSSGTVTSNRESFRKAQRPLL